jgi:chromosomal replication initiator protein
MSLKSIGEKFGKRDHSTVIHAIQTVNDQLDVDSNFKAQIEEIRKKLK